MEGELSAKLSIHQAVYVPDPHLLLTNSGSHRKNKVTSKLRQVVFLNALRAVLFIATFADKHNQTTQPRLLVSQVKPNVNVDLFSNNRKSTEPLFMTSS